MGLSFLLLGIHEHEYQLRINTFKHLAEHIQRIPYLLYTDLHKHLALICRWCLDNITFLGTPPPKTKRKGRDIVRRTCHKQYPFLSCPRNRSCRTLDNF